MKLPGQYRLDCSRFFDSTMWHLQYQGLIIKFLRVAKSMAMACKIYAIVYGILQMNNVKRNNPQLGLDILLIEAMMTEKDIIFYDINPLDPVYMLMDIFYDASTVLSFHMAFSKGLYPSPYTLLHPAHPFPTLFITTCSFIPLSHNLNVFLSLKITAP